MATLTTRIDERDHRLLAALAKMLNKPMTEVLGEAVRSNRREVVLDQYNARMAELQQSPDDWAEESAEERLWESTLGDGLEAEPYGTCAKAGGSVVRESGAGCRKRTWGKTSVRRRLG